MKKLSLILLAAGSICAVADMLSSPQLFSFGMARFLAEMILILLSVIFGWRQIYLAWREKRRWWSTEAKIDLRILWRPYNALRDKVLTFEGSSADRKLRNKEPDNFSPDGSTIRLAQPDEISLLVSFHGDLSSTDNRLVQQVLRHKLADQSAAASMPEALRHEVESARSKEAAAAAKLEAERESLRLRDPEAYALKEMRELQLAETICRLRELRILENVRTRGMALEPSDQEPIVDLAVEIESERKEMEALMLLKQQLEEALQLTTRS